MTSPSSPSEWLQWKQVTVYTSAGVDAVERKKWLKVNFGRSDGGNLHLLIFWILYIWYSSTWKIMINYTFELYVMKQIINFLLCSWKMRSYVRPKKEMWHHRKAMKTGHGQWIGIVASLDHFIQAKCSHAADPLSGTVITLHHHWNLVLITIIFLLLWQVIASPPWPLVTPAV